MMRKWRRSVVGVFIIVIGCSTTNTQNWAITNPTQDQRFEYNPSTGVMVPVKLTCNVGGASNNVGVFSVNNFQFSDKIYPVTSSAANPFEWSGDVKVAQMPPDYTVTTVIDAKLCTGIPAPSVTGTNATQFTTQNIKLHQVRLSY